MITAQELIASAKANCRCLDAREAAAKIQQEDVLLIDIREPAENQAAAIPGALHVPRGVLEFNITDICNERSREIVLHCGGGGRASLAAESLKQMGYENVYIVDAQFEELLTACNS